MSEIQKLYDLDAKEQQYLYTVPIDGGKAPLVVTVRTYEENDGINYERDRELLMSEAKEEEGTDIKVSNTEADRTFFFKHLAGVTCEGRQVPRETFESIDARYSPPLSSTIIQESLRPKINDDDFTAKPASDGRVLSVFERLESSSRADVIVPMYVTLYDPQTGKEAEIKLVSTFRPPNALDSQQWEGRIHTRSLKRGRSKAIIDYNVIRDAYNARIKTVAGFTMGVTPCDSSSRDQWVGKIPFLFKLAAISQAFGKARKNS